MITRPTTLILGAGASAPFGFPTGKGLLSEVLNLTNEGSPLSKTQSLFELGFTRDDVRKFRELLFKSNKGSVDAFLEYRPEFIQIGKAAMAIVLISYEKEYTLFKRDGNGWYEYLFSELNTKFDDFDKNQLNILTFNYDRSLEHCLLTSLMSSYGKSVDECLVKLNTIPIIHLHGDLGELGRVIDDDNSIRPYSDELNSRTIWIATNRIKIIHEKSLNEQQFNLAKRILSSSEIVCFLGFGYHELNMKRLGFNPSKQSQDYSTLIFGTSFGLTNAECNKISSQYHFGLRDGIFDYAKLDVLGYLREKGILYL